MGFRNGAYASIFSVKKGQGNYHDVNLAISKKNRDGDGYVTDFRGFVRFIGDASTQIAKFEGKDSKNNGNRPITRVKLGSVDVSNSYNPSTNKSYTNFVVFSFEPADADNNNTSKSMKSANDYANNVPTGDDEEVFT